MNAVMREFMKAAREAPRLFFLPVTGAIEAVRREMGHSRRDLNPNAQVNARSHDSAQDRH
jgi:hypothetical protein